jgi:hypothetical protein
MMFSLQEILLIELISAAPFCPLGATPNCPHAVMVKLFHKSLGMVRILILFIVKVFILIDKVLKYPGFGSL